jgi:hypothetical protein
VWLGRIFRSRPQWPTDPPLSQCRTFCHVVMRASKRLEERTVETARQERVKQRQQDKDIRGEPHLCIKEGCKRAARHRASLCDFHRRDTVIDKNLLPLIYQGCPQYLPHKNHRRIRWAPFRQTIATWIEGHLELCAPDPRRNPRYPEIVLVSGWRGSSKGLSESRPLSGTPTLTYS